MSGVVILNNERSVIAKVQYLKSHLRKMLIFDIVCSWILCKESIIIAVGNLV